MSNNTLNELYESELIEWLESPEGERWSKTHHRLSVDYSQSQSLLMSVKDDVPDDNALDIFVALLWYV